MMVLSLLILVAVANDPVFEPAPTVVSDNQSASVQEAKQLNDNLEKILEHLRQVEPAAEPKQEPESVGVDESPAEIPTPDSGGYASASL